MEQNHQRLLEAQNQSADSEKKYNIFDCPYCDNTWKVESKSDVCGVYSAECETCSKKRRAEDFDKICPPLYRHTDISRLPQDQLKKAMEWQYGPRGLIFLGETGLGKTRTAWTLIRRVLVDDKKYRNFMWFDAIGFGHKIALHYRKENAEEWLDKVAECPLVFFDDLGKLKLTERAEVELFGIIERRCAAELPIIVTTNDTGDSLASRMTDNRGPAMIRRLREFCEPIQF